MRFVIGIAMALALVLPCHGVFAAADDKTGAPDSRKRKFYCQRGFNECYAGAEEYCNAKTSNPAYRKACKSEEQAKCGREWGERCRTRKAVAPAGTTSSGATGRGLAPSTDAGRFGATVRTPGKLVPATKSAPQATPGAAAFEQGASREAVAPTLQRGKLSTTRPGVGGPGNVGGRPLLDPAVPLSDGGGAPLPQLAITRVPDGFPGKGALEFEYQAAPRNRAGPVSVELWLRGSRRNASLVHAIHDVELERVGRFGFFFRSDPDAVAEQCRRSCHVRIDVRRGRHVSSFQMPLVARFFVVQEGRGHSRGARGGLNDYVIEFDRVFQRARRPLGEVRARLERFANRPGGPIDGVDVQLWFRDRAGAERIVASSRSLTLDGRRSVLFTPRGFVIPETGGTLEVRALRGTASLQASGDFRPTRFRVGEPSRVRDRR